MQRDVDNKEEYLQKLKELPPLDKQTETLLRALANAILDRLEESNNNTNTKEAE